MARHDYDFLPRPDGDQRRVWPSVCCITDAVVTKHRQLLCHSLLLLWLSIAHDEHTHTHGRLGDCAGNRWCELRQEPLSHTDIITAADAHRKAGGWHSRSSTCRWTYARFKRRRARLNYLCMCDESESSVWRNDFISAKERQMDRDEREYANKYDKGQRLRW